MKDIDFMKMAAGALVAGINAVDITLKACALERVHSDQFFECAGGQLLAAALGEVNAFFVTGEDPEFSDGSLILIEGSGLSLEQMKDLSYEVVAKEITKYAVSESIRKGFVQQFKGVK